MSITRFFRNFSFPIGRTTEELKNRVQDVYYGVDCSIGRWRRTILESYDSYEIPNTFEKYKESCIEQMAVEFLGENGIEPIWK